MISQLLFLLWRHQGFASCGGMLSPGTNPGMVLVELNRFSQTGKPLLGKVLLRTIAICDGTAGSGAPVSRLPPRLLVQFSAPSS